MDHFNMKKKNLELINLKNITYAQPITLSLTKCDNTIFNDTTHKCSYMTPEQFHVDPKLPMQEAESLIYWMLISEVYQYFWQNFRIFQSL